jgi:hypothetical protein
LKPFSTDLEYYCDLCGATMISSQKLEEMSFSLLLQSNVTRMMMSCRECDWDVCKACYDNHNKLVASLVCVKCEEGKCQCGVFPRLRSLHVVILAASSYPTLLL